VNVAIHALAYHCSLRLGSTWMPCATPSPSASAGLAWRRILCGGLCQEEEEGT
jgi:hypothetical protein